MWTGPSTRLALITALLLLAHPAAAQEPAGQTPATQEPGAAPRRLSLAEALRLAQATSEELVIADAGVLRARGEQKRARSGYFPQISGSATYTRTFASEFSGFGGGADEGDVEGAVAGEGGGEPPGAAGGPRGCPPFMPHPMLPLPAQVDSLGRAVQCLTTAPPPPPDLGQFFGDGTTPFGNPNRYDLGISLSQTIYTGGRISAQNRAAEAGRSIADIDVRATRAQLALDVATAYLDAALADQLSRIAQQSVVQAERTLSVTQLAVEAGRQAEFDALRARVTRDNERAVAIQRRARRDIAFARLKTLLDLPQPTRLALTTALGENVLEVPPPIAALTAGRPGPDTAVDVRAPVRQATERVEVQDALLRVARAQRLPDIALSSQFGEVAFPGSALPGFQDFRTTFFIALSAQLPIFTGGRIRGDELVAEANLREAGARLEQVRELATLDARTALEELAAARAAWQASTGTVAQAERAYEIAELRYREGIASLLELTDTRVMLDQARANRAVAARDLQVAQTRLALLPDLPLQVTAPAAVPAATVAPVEAPPAVTPEATLPVQPVTPTGPVRQPTPGAAGAARLLMVPGGRSPGGGSS